jgi:hypothetical protein
MRAALRWPLAALCLALFGVLLTGCSLHPGGAEIAYLRGDQLWVVNPDGADPRQLAPHNVRGYAWSPDHHELVFRYGASTPTLPFGATWAERESVSELAVVSISGGTPIQISANAQGQYRSDAWWDPQGNRLLYREYLPGESGISTIYVESQNDQPVGIASKVVIGAATLPTLSPDGAHVAVIDPTGAVRVGAASQVGAVVARDALISLPGNGMPARLLWQPGHDALLYPTTGANGAVTLTLFDLTSHATRTITSVSGLRDAAFSPDGSLLLLATPTGYLVWPVTGQAARASIAESDPLAQAFWSPDGRWLLIEDTNGARLIHTSDWSVQGTLTYTAPLAVPANPTQWRPAASSPWSGDSSAFTFASAAAATWQGKALPAPRNASAGLYVQSMTHDSASGQPRLIASGAISAPGWSCPDPSTTLLVAAA